MSKYRSRKVEFDGYLFDSTKERARYSELRLLEQAGVISKLRLQPRLPCVVNGVKVCDYVGDFAYIEDGCTVIEDVKSEYTSKLPVYRLKRKLVWACHGIEIREHK